MGMDLAFDSPVGIRIVVAGMPDNRAPMGHNLDGVVVPVEVGLGMVGIPSRAAIDTEAAADTVHFVVHMHSCSVADMEHFSLVVYVVVGMHYTED